NAAAHRTVRHRASGTAPPTRIIVALVRFSGASWRIAPPAGRPPEYQNSPVCTRLTTKYPMPNASPPVVNAVGIARAIVRKPAIPVISSPRRTLDVGATTFVSHA